MIQLLFLNGDIFLFNVEDWPILRKEHRIVGQLNETSCFKPALPLKVMPEEAILLIDNEIAVVFKIPNFSTDSASYQHFQRELLATETVEFKNNKRQQAEQMLDSLLKRRKANDNSTREDIIKEEVERLPPIDETNMIWPTLLKCLCDQQTEEISRSEILKLTTETKCAVFADLWQRGYHITSGEKFGGDFLVYLGDPVVHHAIFIVKCTAPETSMQPSELVACGRLGVSVKKNVVLASVKDGELLYLTINWLDA